MAEPNSAGSSDRRRHVRYDLIAQVHVRQAKSDYVLELRNISQSGAMAVLGTLARPSWIDVDRVVESAIRRIPRAWTRLTSRRAWCGCNGTARA